MNAQSESEKIESVLMYVRSGISDEKQFREINNRFVGKGGSLIKGLTFLLSHYPKNGFLLLTLSKELYNDSDDKSVIALLDSFECEKEYVVPLLEILAMAFQRERRYSDAERIFDAAVSSPGVTIELLEKWLRLKLELLKNVEAAEFLESALSLYPKNADLLSLLAQVQVAISKDDAVSNMEKSFALHDKEAQGLKLVKIYRSAGQSSKAKDLLEKIIAKNSASVEANAAYAQIKRFSQEDLGFIKQLETLYDKFPSGSKDRAEIGYSLSKAFDDLGEFEQSIRYVNEASDIMKVIRDSTEIDTTSRLSDYMKLAFRNDESLSGYSDVQPVFIVGMPRSGTTLLESSMGMHSRLGGIGERDLVTQVSHGYEISNSNTEILFKMSSGRGAFWEASEPHSCFERGEMYSKKAALLAGGKSRTVDKMPSNFINVGLIRAFLPQSKVIFMRRHPVATCLSIFKTNFAEGHGWSYCLKDIARYYRLANSLMKYWSELYPDMIYSVSYENLVTDFEREMTSVFEFLGESWEDGCKDFHKRESVVSTASMEQVRQPLYTSSILSWKNYRDYLDDFSVEIQDLIEEYESEVPMSA